MIGTGVARVAASALGALAILALPAAAAISCGAGAPAPATPASGAPSAKPRLADRSGFAGGDVGAYHSDRIGLTLSLPDRASWSIVDRADTNSGWLIATHARTATTLRARRFDETSLVGRRECEARARVIGELPRADAVERRGFQTLVDEPIRRPRGWDGWQWVAFEPRAHGGLAGHVFLVTGHAHSCLVVHVATESPSDAHVNDLADRLELFSSTVVATLSVDRAEGPPGLRPELPTLPPTPGVP